jgi:hypothetical protein
LREGEDGYFHVRGSVTLPAFSRRWPS